jgi:hypothetical protein
MMPSFMGGRLLFILRVSLFLNLRSCWGLGGGGVKADLLFVLVG